MASCGPLNPQEQLKKHINRESTPVGDAHHVDPHLSQPKFRSHRPDDSAADFARFNSPASLRPHLGHSYSDADHRFAIENEFISAKLAQRAHTPVDPAGYSGRGSNLTPDLSSPNRRYLEGAHVAPSPARQGTPPDQWAQEFNSLNIQDSLDQPNRVPVAPQGFNHHPQFVAPVDAVPTPFVRSSVNQALPHQQLDTVDDSAFEAAFVNVEKNLQNFESTNVTDPKNKIRDASRERGEEAGLIAEKIMQQVSSRSSPDLMEKMKGSQFMTLMNKMRTNEIRLDSEAKKLVGKDGVVNAYDIVPDASHDWPPQRKSVSATAVEQPSMTRAETPKPREFDELTSSRRTSPQASCGTAYREGIMGLEDPDTYFRNVQKSLRPNSPTADLKFNSFAAAKKLSEISLNKMNWEEKYDDWN